MRFAVTHRSHSEITYRPEPYRPDSEDVRQTRVRTARMLCGSDDVDASRLAAGVAVWALVHGVATLWLGGNLPPHLGGDREEITRVVATHLSVGRDWASAGTNLGRGDLDVVLDTHKSHDEACPARQSLSARLAVNTLR